MIIKYVITIYEPIIWLQVFIGIAIVIPGAVMSYRAIVGKKIDEWLLLCIYLSFSFLILSFYFPYDIWFLFAVLMLSVPFCKKKSDYWSYRVNKKKELLGIAIEKEIAEMRLDINFSEDELNEIRREAKQNVRSQVGKYILVIWSPTIVFILICMIRGGLYG